MAGTQVRQHLRSGVLGYRFAIFPQGVRIQTMRFIFFLLGLSLLSLPGPWGHWASAEENRRTLKSDSDQEYYLYLPSKFEPKKRYWLFVAVHGLKSDGRGALGFSNFADEGDCIVVGPSFSDGFQFPSQGAGKKMLAIFAELSKEFRLYPNFFLTGMSAGAQFAHRFTLENPKVVLACAAHSAGSWDNPTDSGRSVAFLVTCGEADTEYDRIGKAHQFADNLKKKGYKATTAWFAGIGHTMCPETYDTTKDLYWTVTTGLTKEQRERVEGELEKAGGLIKEEKYTQAMKHLDKIADFKRESAYKNRAASLISEVEKKGSERLAEIQKQSKTEPAEAIAALEEFVPKFKGTKAGTSAQRMLTSLKNKGGAGAAGPGEPPADKGSANVPEGPKATEDAEQAPQPATGVSSAERMRRQWLTMGKNFITNKQPVKARGYLEKILQNYPDSEESKEARKLLEGL